MKDALGVEVEVGCTVVYPCRRSSSCWLGRGRVVEIDEARGKLKLTGGELVEKFDFKTLNVIFVPPRDRWIAGGDHVAVVRGSV